MKEEWRDVKGFEGSYQVSNLGMVKSLDREVPFNTWHLNRIGKLLSSKTSRYCDISLYKHGKIKKATAHRLVCEAFIPNPENKPYCNHKDGNKNNNVVSNLEWVTAKENAQHALKTRLLNPQLPEDIAKRKTSKLSILDVREIRRLLSLKTMSKKEIGKIFNVSEWTIYNINSGRTWKGVEYKNVIS